MFMFAICPAPHRVRRAREPRKSPKRVRKEYPAAGPQKCPKSAPRSLKRVRKESESQALDSFRTLSRLRGAFFGHFWGPAPGYSFRTLLRGSRARRARETLCGAGPIASLCAFFPLEMSSMQFNATSRIQGPLPGKRCPLPFPASLSPPPPTRQQGN